MHVVIIGGGAAGFFCAANIKPSKHVQVTILEKSAKVLSKVKISGGGRCNVTHNGHSIAEMCQYYPRGSAFLKKAFHHFFVPDTIRWFQDQGVELKTEADGRMFPSSNDSQTIVDCLSSEAAQLGVSVQLHSVISSIEPLEHGFTINLAGDASLHADVVVVACGGFPKLAQYAFLRKLAHAIVAPLPSLFTFNIPKHPIIALQGLVAKQALVKIMGTQHQSSGPVLITHWGLSGPAVLKLSAFAADDLAACNYQAAIQVNWLSDFNENSLRDFLLAYKKAHPQQKVMNISGLELPTRLLHFLWEIEGFKADQKWLDLPHSLLNKMVKNLCAYEMKIEGKTTFKEEFVTAGGIDLSTVDPNTMMSKHHPRLYFIGEVLNVDGITGGYNFQSAWTSAAIAAKSINEDIANNF